MDKILQTLIQELGEAYDQYYEHIKHSTKEQLEVGLNEYERLNLEKLKQLGLTQEQLGKLVVMFHDEAHFTRSIIRLRCNDPE